MFIVSKETMRQETVIDQSLALNAVQKYSSLGHLTMPVLILGWWLDLKLRQQQSVCVGFLYTLVVRCLPSLCTNTSRNGSLPSSSVSIVNSMLGLSELTWERKSSRESRPCGQMTNVSSTYRNHREGHCLAVLMAIVSKYSMYRSSIITSHIIIHHHQY